VVGAVGGAVKALAATEEKVTRFPSRNHRQTRAELQVESKPDAKCCSRDPCFAGSAQCAYVAARQASSEKKEEAAPRAAVYAVWCRGAETQRQCRP